MVLGKVEIAKFSHLNTLLLTQLKTILTSAFLPRNHTKTYLSSRVNLGQNRQLIKGRVWLAGGMA